MRPYLYNNASSDAVCGYIESYSSVKMRFDVREYCFGRAARYSARVCVLHKMAYQIVRSEGTGSDLRPISYIYGLYLYFYALSTQE